MNDFRSFQTSKRGPAKPMEPVVDPAGWSADELRNVAEWSYRISERDADELAAGIAAVRRRGVPVVEVARENFPLAGFGDVLADVRRELMDGRGIVMLQNFPVERFDREETAIAYIGLGAYLAAPCRRTSRATLGHVKDLGGDTRIRIPALHDPRRDAISADACDYVGLLYLQGSRHGGASRWRAR